MNTVSTTQTDGGYLLYGGHATAVGRPEKGNTLSIDLQLEKRLQAALHCGHPRIWLYLVRTLAKGKPVAKASIALALDMPMRDIETALIDFKDTVYDDDGNVVACGLSLVPTPHRLIVDGRDLFTWCALDALMYPVALQQMALVESRCPVTEVAVRLTVTPTGVTALTPVETVVSLVIPAAQSGCCNVRNAFCSRVHFVSSPEAADEWRSTYPEATVLSVKEAWRLGCAIVRHRLAGCNS